MRLRHKLKMITNSLPSIQRRLERELWKYADLFTNCCKNWEKSRRTSGNDRILGDFTIVLLHDSWARFCRSLVLISAACNPITLSGVRLTKAPGIQRIDQVIPHLMSQYRRRRNEPRWGDARDCIDAAGRLEIQNLTAVTDAIGSSSSPVEEIRCLRNFIVHKNRETALSVRQRYSMSRGDLCAVAIAGDFQSGGIRLFQLWTRELVNISMASIR